MKMDRTVKLLFAGAIALLCFYLVAIVQLGSRGPALLKAALLLTGAFALLATIIAPGRSVAAIRKEHRSYQCPAQT